MRLAIVCAMLLGFFGLSAAAAGEGQLSPGSPSTAAGPSPSVLTSTPASDLVSVSASASGTTPAKALPDAPVPIEPATANALPASPAAIIILKTAPKTHRFFDTQNSMGLSSMAASLAADALSTQKGLSYPGFYEMNPVARPFVKTSSGEAAYTSGTFALLAGTMYVAHKTHHHKLERILPFAVAGWEGLLSFRNYRVIANRR